MASKVKILAAKSGACEDCGGTIYEVETDLGILKQCSGCKSTFKEPRYKVIKFSNKFNYEIENIIGI
ncbi:Uncharacterised protein [uncultured Clostridium sp.]|nr:Uncharacterised protein [uncultured Clostridium sp.]